jgi:hypothetical protein
VSLGRCQEVPLWLREMCQPVSLRNYKQLRVTRQTRGQTTVMEFDPFSSINTSCRFLSVVQAIQFNPTRRLYTGE